MIEKLRVSLQNVNLKHKFKQWKRKKLRLAASFFALAVMPGAAQLTDFNSGLKNRPPATDITYGVGTGSMNRICAASGFVYIMQNWGNPGNQGTCNPTLIFNGGKIAPATNQVVKVGKFYCATAAQCFDTLTNGGGPGSIKFNLPAPSIVPGDWFGAYPTPVSDTADTASNGLNSAMQANQEVGLDVNNNPVYMGSVSLGPTGTGGVTHYAISQTFTPSARVNLIGSPGIGTTIGLSHSPTSFTGSYMVSYINADSPEVSNTNFDEIVQDIYLDAYTNAASPLGCLEFPASIGSYIKNFRCNTQAIGLYIYKSGDNISLDSASFFLYPDTDNAMKAQAIVWNPIGRDTNVNIFKQVKVYGAGSGYGCSGRPAIDFSQGIYTTQINGINFENIPCAIVIGDVVYGGEVTNITASPHCFGSCTLSNNPYVALVSPTAQNIKIKGEFAAYKYGIVLGHKWRPSTVYTMPYTVIDYNGNEQNLTTNGTSGSGDEPGWGTSGTTNDGTAVWTFVTTSLPVCDASMSVSINCAMPSPSFVNQTASGNTGASSGSDANFYSLDYDSNVFFNKGIFPGNVYLQNHLIAAGPLATLSGTDCVGASSLVTDLAGIFTATAATSCTITFAATRVNPVPTATGKGASGSVTVGIAALSTSAVTFAVSAAGTYYYQIADLAPASLYPIP